jgi:S-adenosylmethionine:tRNA ribosyltransferase-isomerase
VIPARLFARKQTGGRVEILLLRRLDDLTWESMVGGKGVRAGTRLTVEGGPHAEVLGTTDGPSRTVRFEAPIEPFFSSAGHVPLPPYIHRQLVDPERYQTVYADAPGSAAAPTAGLHFTPGLLKTLQAMGIAIAYVTLHVGLDTFAPVSERDPAQHKIHQEWCEVPADVAEQVHAAHASGRRVVAVGTTTARTLETAARQSARQTTAGEARLVEPFAGPTSLFILPGYVFRVVDGLITNFHLPKSTLLMMVSAFAGRESILAAYRLAQAQGYRFYSFGDAMLIL